jgi:Domain of unknown function (DUF4352)
MRPAARPGAGGRRRDRIQMALTALVLLLAFVLTGCGAATLSLKASAPFAYPSPVGPSLERVAVLLTITNNSQDDLAVDPGEFAARDSGNRVYPANAAATAADASLVRVTAGQLGMNAALSLPVMTLRQNDVLTGFVVFDVPQGVRPVALIFRQPDNDTTVALPAAR